MSLHQFPEGERTMIRFYPAQSAFYCGIDLHARNMYVCLLDREGNTKVHQKLPNRGTKLVKLLEPYRQGVVVGVESTFNWYWLADLCVKEEIEFALGHAFYLRAIHGAKTKNDRFDSYTLARLMAAMAISSSTALGTWPTT